MRTYRFFQVDVFTDRPFGGNPLAVFPEAEGLSEREMQQIAKEMNLSETTFILPPDEPAAQVRVRIFTPATEVPLAGHPVVGTHYVLGQMLQRYRLTEPVTRITQQLKAGVLPVDLYVEGGAVTRVVMTQAQPQFLAEIADTSRLAAALSLKPGDIVGPCQVVSTGLPQLMIPVRSLPAVRDSGPNVAELLEIGPQVDTSCFVLFTLETLHPESTVHVRMYAPAFGIMEDPATGSAAGGLGAYLVKYGVVPVERPTTRVVIEQGYEIDRPSTLYTEVDTDGDAITSVRVGGQVSPVIEGTIRLP